MGTLHIDPILLRETQLRNLNLKDAVETFIRGFIDHPSEEVKEIKISPFIERLGVDLNLPVDFDEKEAYRKHLEEKYG